MNEHLCAEIYLARANSEMQRSGIELVCLGAFSLPLNFIGRSAIKNAVRIAAQIKRKRGINK